MARQAFSLPVLVAAFLLVVTPFGLYLADLPFIANMIFLSLMYAIAVMAWNLLMGYTGQLSIGHAVFFGVGAYTTMILVVYYNVTPWIGMFVAGAVAALAGLGLEDPLHQAEEPLVHAGHRSGWRDLQVCVQTTGSMWVARLASR